MAEIAIATPDDATVVVTVTVATPVETAYRSFTDVTRLTHWFWPERFETAYELDPTPGGIWRARSEVIEMGFTAVFGEVVPNERLAMSWQWDGDDAITKVEIEFAAGATPSTSTVAVTHSDNATIPVRDEHQAGWTDCLTRLADLA